MLRDGGPGFCQFAITNACNAHCQFCNFRVGSGMTGERIFVSLEDSKAAMRILADNGVEYMALVGGEPTLHPKLPEILQSAQSLGINTLISTNGSYLTDERVKEYADAGLGSAIISIDAPGVEAHEANRGLPGVCERIARTNSEFHRLGVSTTASVTISKLLGDLSQLPAFLKSLNFTQVTFSYPLRSLDSSFLGFSDSEIIEFTDDELIAIFDTIIKMKKTFPVVNPTASLREMQRFIRGERQMFPCLAGFKYFHLDWNLDLYRCHAWPKKMCTIWDFDSSKLVRDGCTRCMIDCYRDASVLHNVGIALYDAKVDLSRARPVMALTHVANRALYESAKSILEDFRWIKKLGAGRS
ncbi:MAG: radical SAM protein [Armatimonadota bacterium]|nr:radical SAM protein [bacterium]